MTGKQGEKLTTMISFARLIRLHAEMRVFYEIRLTTAETVR